jgi:hypothetical protein
LRIYSLSDGNSLRTRFSPLLRRRNERAVGFYQMKGLLGWSLKNC